jgi:tetratricopeptide (TPR) repeat protein
LPLPLAHLHEQGLVHRDIKPSNIIFVKDVAKLGDIGLVTDSGDTQSIVGTEGYLPPEGPGTPQADLYSLGKVLYEISTGLDRRRFAALPEDSWNWPDRDQLMEFNEIVLRACAKDPAHRYATANELQSDLELLTAGRSVKKARSSERRWLLSRRLSAAAVLVAIALGALKHRGVPPEVAEGGPPSTNQEANARCDKALRQLRSDAHGEFPGVYSDFHDAIKLDPHFARPYVGLVELVARETLPGVTYLPEDNQRALTRRLVELAPECAAARCAEAGIAYYDWDFPTAEREARRAIKICPDSEFIHTSYGFFLLMWGRAVEARRQLEISKRLNSSKVQVHRMLAHTYYVERNFPRAIEIYLEAIAWERRDLPSHMSLEHAYLANNQYEKAIDVSEAMENLKREPTPQASARFARPSDRTGRRDTGRKC